jgi:hypothetical protein
LHKGEKFVQEAQRLEVLHCFNEEAIRCVTQLVQGRPISPILNLDTVGISGFADRTSQNVIAG